MEENMKKKFLALMMVAILALSLAACGGGGSSDSAEGGDSNAFAGGQTFSIKIGHSDTTGNLIHASLENFKAYVEEQSGGKCFRSSAFSDAAFLVDDGIYPCFHYVLSSLCILNCV